VLRTCVALLIQMALAVAGVAGPPAEPLANLAGVVYAEDSSQRIGHASVWLCDDGGNRIREAITTDSGEFAFQRLHVGAYILKISAAGFVPLETDVNVDFSSAAGISIFLRPVGKAPLERHAEAAISAHELSEPAAARKLAESGKKKLYSGNNPEGALQDFQAAVAKAPDYYEAYYQIGMAYLSLKNPAQAEPNLKKSVDLSNQSYAEADLALAVLLLGRRDAAEGEPLLRRGLELNPNSWLGFYELGKLELYRMHLDAALDAARHAKTLAPQQPKVYHLLSLIHLRQKNYQAALADLDAYIRLDPDSPDGQTAKQIRVDMQHKLENSHP